MITKELRIGNLLKGGVVDEFSLLLIHFNSPRKKNSVYGLSHPNSKPVKLTEEWLIKLGFDNSLVKDIFLFHDCSFPPTSIVEDDGRYIFRKRIELEVEYVHQLQNLYFALTGEELCFTA